MVKITYCVAKSMATKKGYKCGKWRTENKKGFIVVSHYGTEMLKISPHRTIVERATGFESVSDKQGVNKIIRDLGISKKDIKEIEVDRGFSFKD